MSPSFSTLVLATLSLFLPFVDAHKFSPDLVPWNINVNPDPNASVLDYVSSRPNTTYTPSPQNWRQLPFYTLLLDKFADGDPRNNDFFGTVFEQDAGEVNLRFGGDIRGLQLHLDYLHGMGIRAIYIAGTPFINMLWQADSYSPLDFSLLDPHWGTLQDWRDVIDDIHAHGMYLMADFTVGTMSDLIGFEGHLNTSTPFSLKEYNAVWKSPNYAPWNITEYPDFKFNNERNASCRLPTLWQDDASIVEVPIDGCYASEFDQFGDMEAFGFHPDWQRQLSKFASVQDRLREWQPAVMDKIKKFSCMAIVALDIDGIRIDKATQVTVDALTEWTSSTHQCAKQVGKNNFFIAGEVTGGDTFGALYYGRGRTRTQRPPDLPQAARVNSSQNEFFLRDNGRIGLDAVAFHYSIYRSLTRFLGMDGNLQVAFDVDVNFVNAWNQIFVNNDFLNYETGLVDPRHMYGVTNFDVFRWPALVSGTEKLLLGTFITSLVMPGIPLAYYGEEQAFYILDNGAANYLFGRQPMSSSRAWQRHGCYKLGSTQYYNMPLQKALLGCEDDWNSLDHFDPTSPPRRLMSRFHQLRTLYPVLQDGFGLVEWGKKTYNYQLPGSNITTTETGMWHVSRSALPGVQNLTGTVNSSDQVWLIYTNENKTAQYTFDCQGSDPMVAPYVSGTTVRNLFAPYETYTLQDTVRPFNEDGKEPYRGCIPSITLEPLSFKALVPLAIWTSPSPMLTKFVPGHDARLLVEDGMANATTVDIAFQFNMEMSCEAITNGLALSISSPDVGLVPRVQNGSVQCGPVDGTGSTYLAGDVTSAWQWSGKLENVPDGVLELVLDRVPNANSTDTTGAKDRLLLRKGSSRNVMVFPNNDHDDASFGFDNDEYTFTHQAKGADLFRYSWNFGTNYSQWTTYENVTQIPKNVFENSDNFWEGQHIIVQYWSQRTTSSTQSVHADRGHSKKRRVPQMLVRGPYNNWGFDKGLPTLMQLKKDNTWEIELMAQWPTYFQINILDYNDFYYGDTDGDGVLDRLPPNTVAPNFLNISAPPAPHLAWALLIDDSTGQWTLKPRGHSTIGAIMFVLLLIIPLLTAIIAVIAFRWAFYGIRHNKWGVRPKQSHYLPIISKHHDRSGAGSPLPDKKHHLLHNKHGERAIIGWPEDPNKRRSVLIATLEYELIDWKLKVKIGGLGVMSSLMGKAMTDVDLIWVVPKVKDLEYPPGDPAEPIEVIIFGEPYLIEVETHTLDNITWVILESPVFRAQTKADPYPSRMDDLSSAIFYSTWNQAIAATIRRNPGIDIYHVNDYHGALAPIYLLPKVIPVCLSLHNAEFQGLWPLRTKEEMKEVCSAFNISKEHCTKYVQFGNTFNLLHAAASFISVHQKSVGVAGVSDKYGKRSWARYPALWTLKHVDSLPNPDPTDIAALDEQPVELRSIKIDAGAEAQRPGYKRQAQEWAGIKQEPNADLFVFVGRWSKQKGVDLIADIMPSILEKKPSVQLICVGPVIDLYGRFAAEKLARLMEIYPERVYSKPEFTALPPYLFSGADFALIPSRDEPFGLVAVEFGRKGALGVGSRLGGLGLMPGWWFPVESTSTNHMLSQFAKTIKLALKSTQEERAVLRARSAVQRFPVVEWRQRTEDFHKRSINTSRDLAGADAWRPSDCEAPVPQPNFENQDWTPEQLVHPEEPGWGTGSTRSSRADFPPRTPGENTPFDPHHLQAPPRMQEFGSRTSISSDVSDGEDYFTSHSRRPSAAPSGSEQHGYLDFLSRANKAIAKEQKHVGDPFLDGTRPPTRPFSQSLSRISSRESIASIMDEKSDSPLNKAMESFTDQNGEVAKTFVAKLQSLDAENSKGELSIERFLVKSEEAYFHDVRKEKIYAASVRSKRESTFSSHRSSFHYDNSRPGSPHANSSTAAFDPTTYAGSLPNDTSAPLMTRMQIFMAREIKGWPLYTIILAIGQMLGATSFQITLLTGQNFQNTLELYVLGVVFLVASIVWYTLFRMKPSVWVLSLPWIFFGLAFFLVGLPSVSSVFDRSHDAITSAATWCYAIASAAGFLFFGLNFGEEAGAATEVWTMRACIVQGSQQIWVTALWYWGASLNGAVPGTKTPWWIVLILWPLSIMSFVFMLCIFKGLPEYYRQVPPKVPNFIRTLFRRKLVVWFLASEILRDYWLSGPYGRNWSFLWSSVVIPKWAVALLVVVFFIGVWALMIYILTEFSKTHTWLLPVFAVGLGAPRWCQMLWGTSSLALYIPWGGAAGPYLGTSLWLWLGVLDAIQGVGLGMILLQTLSRLHVCATLAFAQIIGCICVMVARATAPNRLGPGTVFPDASTWDFEEGLQGSPMASVAFWAALICQIVIVIGYFWFYRKEQLSRP